MPHPHVVLPPFASLRCAAVTSFCGATTEAVHVWPSAKFVSLRASATDASGDTVRQTIIRAYAV